MAGVHRWAQCPDRHTVSAGAGPSASAGHERLIWGDLDRLGAFFSMELWAGPDDGSWSDLPLLVSGTRALEDRIAGGRTHLAHLAAVDESDIERRIVVSLAAQSLADGSSLRPSPC